MGEFAVSIEHSEEKVFQLQGGFAPLTPDQALCPWTPLGAPLPDPIIGSRSARSPCPPLRNPKYATGFLAVSIVLQISVYNTIRTVLL